jgi:hypothetical protein
VASIATSGSCALSLRECEAEAVVSSLVSEGVSNWGTGLEVIAGLLFGSGFGRSDLFIHTKS